jgi:hypothetical protein
MSVFSKLQTAIDTKDSALYKELYHEDFQFVRHQTNTTMNRDQIVSMIEKMFASGAVEVNNHRCLYENDSAMVEHSFMTFPDDSREAVLAFHQLENGKIIRTETGATLIK